MLFQNFPFHFYFYSFYVSFFSHERVLEKLLLLKTKLMLYSTLVEIEVEVELGKNMLKENKNKIKLNTEEEINRIKDIIT